MAGTVEGAMQSDFDLQSSESSTEVSTPVQRPHQHHAYFSL